MACFAPVFADIRDELKLALSPAMSNDVLSFAKGETLIFHRLALPQATVHIAVIPRKAPYQLALGVSDKLSTLPEFTRKSPGALLAANAGYFDPVNGKTISHMKTAQGKVFKTLDNERLTGNEALSPYLEKFDNRPEFRRYACLGDAGTVYDIAETHDAPLPADCSLTFAVGGGPMLLPRYSPYEEGFVDTDPQDNQRVIRDPIGVNTPNARTAIGVRANGDVVLVMAGQDEHRRGVSLPHLAQVFQTLGVEKAMNLDGGSSSGLFVQGQFYYGKRDGHNKAVVRPLKSVLLVLPK